MKHHKVRPEKPSPVEEQIRRAQAEGAFDDLPGHGKPLPDLSEADDPLWWARKLVARERIPVLPPALEIRLRVEQTLAGVQGLTRQEDVRARLETLNEAIRQLNSRARHGPPTAVSPLDVEAELARWRAGRLAPEED